MNEQETNKNQGRAIESYDGSPEDVVFYQTPEQLELQESKKRRQAIWGEEAEAAATGPENPQADAIQADTIQADDIQADTVYETASVNTMGISGPGEIDVTDPHYVNYKPDPYYEYGYGSEPQPKKHIIEGKSQSVLSAISLGTGIASLLLFCCGFSFLISLAAVGTGIAGLCEKEKTTGTKVFCIIGISCGGLALATRVISMICSIAMPLIGTI